MFSFYDSLIFVWINNCNFPCKSSFALIGNAKKFLKREFKWLLRKLWHKLQTHFQEINCFEIHKREENDKLEYIDISLHLSIVIISDHKIVWWSKYEPTTDFVSFNVSSCIVHIQSGEFSLLYWQRRTDMNTSVI